MDIAALSTALNLSQTNGDIGTLMLSKQLDLVEEQGASMVEALERSATPYLGGNIDIRV